MADISLEKDSKISTKEFASLFRVDSQTIRRGYCVNGHYMGLKPVKLPNGRLLWPENEAHKLINPNAQ
jgi:hypothetical protein